MSRGEHDPSHSMAARAATAALLAAASTTAVTAYSHGLVNAAETHDLLNDHDIDNLAKVYGQVYGVDQPDSVYLKDRGLNLVDFNKDIDQKGRISKLSLSTNSAKKPASDHFTPTSLTLLNNYYVSSNPLTPDNSAAASWVLADRPQGTTYHYLPIATIDFSSQTAGEANIIDQQPPGLHGSLEGDQTIETLVNGVILPKADLINEAVRAGTLKSIRLVYNGSPRESELKYGIDTSYYDSTNRIETIVLPRFTSVSFSEVESTITHETAHGLFGLAAISELNNTIADGMSAHAFRQACVALKDEAFKEVGSQIDTLVPYYQMIAAADPRLTPSIDYIINAIHTGTFGDLQYTSGTTPNNEVPECALTDPVASIGLVRTKLHDYANGSDIADNKNIYKAFTELDGKLRDLYRATDVMSIIAEHGYESNPVEGHPEDNVDELAASLFNVAITYGDEFKHLVGNLRPEAATVIRTAYNLVRATYLIAEPGLADVLPDLFDV